MRLKVWVIITCGGLLNQAVYAAGILWHQNPYKLTIEGVELDVADRALGGYFSDDRTVSTDEFGHAAPFLVDVDGDGRRDLVIGSYAGRFRFYRNSGTDAAPIFSREFLWLRGGNDMAQVQISCCIASGPQLYDVDQDGIVDLTAGSYGPGAVYWFKGLGKGLFDTRQMLTDEAGIPVFSHLETIVSAPWESFASNLAWVDWDADGRLDLLSGNVSGELFIRLNAGTRTNGFTPIASQPVFRQRQMEIRIEGGKVIEELHAAPGVADWDGDGLWDILLGTDTGAVYWLRNAGKPGAPEFKTRELLIGAGEGVEQWIELGASPRRGIRAQIHAVDYNLDGKMDLLVGDWSYTMSPRPNLTRKERKELDALRAQLAEIDRQVAYPYYNWRHKWPAYNERKDLLEQAEGLLKQMAPYLEKYGNIDHVSAFMKAHGHVWVFLRN